MNKGPGLSRLWTGVLFVNLVRIGLPLVVRIVSLELKGVLNGGADFIRPRNSFELSVRPGLPDARNPFRVTT